MVSSGRLTLMVGCITLFITSCGSKQDRTPLKKLADQESKDAAQNEDPSDKSADVQFTYTAFGETHDCTLEDAEINGIGGSSGKINVDCTIRKDHKRYELSFAAFSGNKLVSEKFSFIYWQDFLDCNPKQSKCIGKANASASTINIKENDESSTDLSSESGTMEITSVNLGESNFGVQDLRISGHFKAQALKIVVDGVGKDPKKAEPDTISAKFKNIPVTFI